MLTDMARKWSRGLLESLASLLNRVGLTPNGVTLFGFALNCIVGYVLAQDPRPTAGLLVLLAGILDGLDGTLARLTGRVSPFGAFLDSTLDRFSEAVLYFGLLIYFVGQGSSSEPLLIYVTIVGSLMVSYARARAEGLGIECKVGAFTRLERVAVLGFGLMLGQINLTLWVLAVGSNLTAVYRMAHVWRQSRL